MSSDSIRRNSRPLPHFANRAIVLLIGDAYDCRVEMNPPQAQWHRTTVWVNAGTRRA